MPFQPQFDGDFPSLGWEVVDWIENYLAKPDVPDFELMRLYQEQIDFLVEFYRLDPATGRRVYHRGVISRPRGWGKSPMAGMLCAAEGLGPVLFDGWDANGQPVGKPWSMVRTPTVQIAAVSEDQTKNTYDSLIEMLDSDYLYDDYPGLEPLGGFVNLPRGKITPISASATSVKGARAVFGVMDQTEVWYQRNGGHKLASTMRSNAGKVGGTTLETPNAFIPGENSVAEKSANTAAKASAGELREQGVLWDHREAPPDTDMSDEKSLIIGLRRAYGDASNHPDGCVIHDPPCPPGHMDIRRLAAEIWDGDKDPQVSRSDFLNQITHASDSWLSQPEVRSIVDRDKVVCDGDAIVLGFDGSRGRKRGNPDATALIGIRLEDRHIFEVRIWEKTPNDPQDWSPPVLEVVSTIRDCVKRYNVIGFYADPSGWNTIIAELEAEFGRKLKLKASRNEPMSVWPRGKNAQVCELLVQFRQAIVLGEVTMSDSPRLIRHFLNARRRSTRSGYLLYKSFPDSPDKIDGAYAAAMAFKAMVDAIANGLDKQKVKKQRKGVIL